MIARSTTESQPNSNPLTERDIVVDLILAWRYFCAWLVRITHSTRIDECANADCEAQPAPPPKTRRSEPSIPYWQKMNARWMNRYARRMANERKKTKRAWRGW